MPPLIIKHYAKLGFSLIAALVLTKIFFSQIFSSADALIIRRDFLYQARNLLQTLTGAPEKLTTLLPYNPDSQNSNPILPPPYILKPDFPPTGGFNPSSYPSLPYFPSSSPPPSYFPSLPYPPISPSPSVTSVPSPPPASPPQVAPSGRIAEFMTVLNAERNKQGAVSLYLNQQLMNAAQNYANILNECSHTAGGTNLQQRLEVAGYPGYGGENITCGQNISASQAFNMWMGSPGHRDNMLNPQWRGAGVGLTSSGNWVLDLGPV